MMYAIVNNGTVTSVLELPTEEEVVLEASRNELVALAPVGCVAGWVLSGNAIVPPYDNLIANSTKGAGLRVSIVEKKRYADDMLERFKYRNIDKQLHIGHGLWLHHRFRAIPVTFMHPVYTGGEVLNLTLDLMNLAIPGDVEVACVALQCLQPSQFDDMTKPYHFFNKEVRDWLVADMKKFLGWT